MIDQEVYDLTQTGQEVQNILDKGEALPTNAQLIEAFALKADKSDTYSKEQLDNLITTPDVNYVSVVATDATTAVTDILPTTGEANTIYRVGNWDGTQYNPTMYALFAWNGTAYVCLAVRSFVGEVYDISVNHPDGQGNPTPYADLAAALGTSGANIPADIRRGGMRIQFIQGTVQSSDNKYVQYRLMSDTFNTTVANWQGVDDEPTAGSDNLVKSGGTWFELSRLGLLGLPYFTIDAFINVSTGELTMNNSGNYKTLLCPVDTSKEYMYFSGVHGGTSSGAMYAYLDEDKSTLAFYPIAHSGWIQLEEMPADTKYFAACIKFQSEWTIDNTNKCCLLEKNRWFTYLEEKIEEAVSEYTNNANVLHLSSATKDKVSQSLFEDGLLYLSKLGVVDNYFSGYVNDLGAYYYTNKANYKSLFTKVIAGKKYKLYISGNNSAMNNAVGIYAFYSDKNIDTQSSVISVVKENRRNQWLEITAPANAKYFGINFEFNGTGDYTDCCFVEETNFVEYLLGKLSDINGDITDINGDITDINGDIAELGAYNNKINPAFNFVSKNLFNATETEDGYVNDLGVFTATTSNPGRNVASKPISIKPNTIYYISGRTNNVVPSICCYDENDEPVKVLKPNGDAYGANAYMYNNNNNKIPNGPFKTPASAKTLRFTIRFNNSPAILPDVMLEEVGEVWDNNFTPSTYKPYNLVPYIETNSLPESVSILKGKRILYNGDSICNSRLDNSPSNNGGAYPVLISEATGSIGVNYAISGALISYNSQSQAHQVCRDVVNMSNDADLVCFEGGVNDWSIGVPLGTMTDGDYTSTFDETTIIGAMESIFQQSLAKWPGKPIVFVIVHKVDSAFTPHSSVTFEEVKNAMVEVCNKWGIPYYNAFDNAALNGGIASQIGTFLYDGWHPKRAGYVHYYVPQLIKLFEAQMQVNRDF